MFDFLKSKFQIVKNVDNIDKYCRYSRDRGAIRSIAFDADGMAQMYMRTPEHGFSKDEMRVIITVTDSDGNTLFMKDMVNRMDTSVRCDARTEENHYTINERVDFNLRIKVANRRGVEYAQKFLDKIMDYLDYKYGN